MYTKSFSPIKQKRKQRSSRQLCSFGFTNSQFFNITLTDENILNWAVEFTPQIQSAKMKEQTLAKRIIRDYAKNKHQYRNVTVVL